MNVAHLIERLQQLPPDKAVLCQVVAHDGSAWNMHFDFRDIADAPMVHLGIHHPALQSLPSPGPGAHQPRAGMLAVLDRAANQARAIAQDHPNSAVLATHCASVHDVRDIASDLILTHTELLRRVDERAGGRIEGASPLVNACAASRAVLARVEGYVPTTTPATATPT